MWRQACGLCINACIVDRAQMRFLGRRLRKPQQRGLQERAHRNNAGHESASCNREAAQLGCPGPEAALVPEASTSRQDGL